jgi:hypothetical protein
MGCAPLQTLSTTGMSTKKAYDYKGGDVFSALRRPPNPPPHTSPTHAQGNGLARLDPRCSCGKLEGSRAKGGGKSDSPLEPYQGGLATLDDVASEPFLRWPSHEGFGEEGCVGEVVSGGVGGEEEQRRLGQTRGNLWTISTNALSTSRSGIMVVRPS